MATTYTIYQNGVQIGTSNTPEYNVPGLTPGKKYNFTVTQNEGSGESEHSESYELGTHGLIALPLPKGTKVNLVYYEDALGMELNGLGTGQRFGGTEPENVAIINDWYAQNKLHLEVPHVNHIENPRTVEINQNLVLLLGENKTMEVSPK